MNFIIKRRVQKIQRGERFEPIIKIVRKPVLYADEAYEVIKEFAGSDILSAPMRIVKMKRNKSFYWLCEHNNISYAAKIGPTSEFIIAPKLTRTDWFDELPLSMTIEVELKNCSRQTKENTTLYVSVFYDADERKLSLQTLNLRGVDIKDFPHDYWNVATIDHIGDCSSDGCCGSVRFAKASDTWNMNLGGVEIYDTVALWTGTKTLIIFKKENYGYTIKQMLIYWENFWRVCGS